VDEAVEAPVNVQDHDVGLPVLMSVKLIQLFGQILVCEAVKFATGAADDV
jgi:hypothetical protein